MTRDTSDWDPLPTEQTGLHPGEAQKFLGGPEPQPEGPQFVVVRSAAPGAAFGGSAPSGKARSSPMSTMGKTMPTTSSAAPRPHEPRQDMLSAMQRSQPTSLPPSLLGPQPTQSTSAMRVVAAPKSEPKPELKAETKPDARIETKPDAKIEAKPDARIEAKPDATPFATESVATAVPSFSAAPAPACAGMDPRQQQPWFLAMPVVEQMRLLRAWQHERDASSATAMQGVARRDRLLERFWVAYVVFFVASLPLMLTEGLMGFVRMAMAGCVTGLLWQIVPHTRAACAWSAVFAYVAVAMLPRAAELVAAPFSLLTSLGGGALVYWLAGLGAAHEQPEQRPEQNAGD